MAERKSFGEIIRCPQHTACSELAKVCAIVYLRNRSKARSSPNFLAGLKQARHTLGRDPTEQSTPDLFPTATQRAPVSRREWNSD